MCRSDSFTKGGTSPRTPSMSTESIFDPERKVLNKINLSFPIHPILGYDYPDIPFLFYPIVLFYPFFLCLSFLTLSFPILPCPILSFPVLFILPYSILSSPVLPFLFLSYTTLSYLFLSYLVLYFTCENLTKSTLSFS